MPADDNKESRSLLRRQLWQLAGKVGAAGRIEKAEEMADWQREARPRREVRQAGRQAGSDSAGVVVGWWPGETNPCLDGPLDPVGKPLPLSAFPA